MKKVIKYFLLVPKRIRKYGFVSVLFKIFVDGTTVLGLDQYISPETRWKMAHHFQTRWKFSQKEMYGPEGYNDRIDSKSLEVLTEFYEVGLDFTGKTFLDVGCGTRGVLPIITAEKKIGVDPTISKVKHIYAHDEINVYYLSEKAEELSLETESVDVICCNNTLNHVEDPALALAQMYRVLKSGGMFLFEIFIEKKNIAHTVEMDAETWSELVSRFFTPVTVKHERLRVKVEIDENMDGHLPMRWGGVFIK